MTRLAGGTLTFLFTDIEGSTRLWERHPEAMQAALARHDAILEQAVGREGDVFKRIGDAFCAAFAEAPAALDAALAIQRALQVESWGETGPLRVRIALHTGPAEQRNDDYFGTTLNRVARILAAGHGGQTLLSFTTAELVRDHLPATCRLRDLGERRLRDLSGTERIFQLVAPDLPAEFPPLRTLDARANNLPAQLTALLGREHEVAAACALLRQPDVHLLTLTGAGGTGKTRLSLQIAADLLDDFEHGVYFIPLAPISDPALVASAISAALEVREVTGKTLLDTLKEYLHGKQMLLVLDNFEQVEHYSTAWQ
jgi:class 3 adenylate cyclase